MDQAGGPHIPEKEGFQNSFLSAKKYIQYIYTDKKKNYIFLICMEIPTGTVAKSYIRKGFLIYEEMHKYFVIFEKGR